MGRKSNSKRNFGNNDREESKSQSKRKVKDTKTLVKELDEKERTRRDFLQKIYQEAGLASKKSHRGN